MFVTTNEESELKYMDHDGEQNFDQWEAVWASYGIPGIETIISFQEWGSTDVLRFDIEGTEISFWGGPYLE